MKMASKRKSAARNGGMAMKKPAAKQYVMAWQQYNENEIWLMAWRHHRQPGNNQLKAKPAASNGNESVIK
jgi:hypothetical protein